MFSSPDKLQAAMQKRVLILVSVFFLISFAAGSSEWAYGIAIGGITSLAHFQSICVVAKRVVDTSSGKARVSAIIAYVIRYLVSAAVLGICFFRPEFSFVAAVMGLSMVKVVIIAEACRRKWIDGLDDHLTRLQFDLEGRE